jgi:uncharacterized protein
LLPQGLKIGQFTYLRDNRLMKFIREPGTAVTVRHVEKGMIRIGDEVMTENVILFRDEIRFGWNANDIENLQEDEVGELIAEDPEILILGCGWQSILPPRDLMFALARKGIGFETMDTPAACRTFNILVSEGRDVAAVLVID